MVWGGKKNIKFGICLIILFLVIVGVRAIYNNGNKENDINEILESKYYAYLPIEAKNYLKTYYEKTGEILL